ncbi:shikimate kinase [Candidatus Sumerlaeota bacterium]|nr:shikimate kinase [Candidatus Sumerlaeota bacterium]
MSQRCVTLVGLMGSGKTTVGRILAETLGYSFLDTDEQIEKNAGKKISKIFEESGEAHFRQLETQFIAGLSGVTSHVIASGGGAILDPQNRHVFKNLGYVVYLKATPRELYQRIKNDTSRPLLQKAADPKAEMARLLAERERYYKEADIIVDTEDLSAEEVQDVLIDELAKRTVGDG